MSFICCDFLRMDFLQSGWRSVENEKNVGFFEEK